MKILLWLWQLPQNVLGLLVIAITRANKTEDGIWICGYLFDSAVSLGDYIIFQKYRVTDIAIKHEKGHQKQSLILGPLYLIIIGLPSACGNIIDRVFHKKWCYTARMYWYYKQPWEAWADKLGSVKRWYSMFV